MLSARFVHYRLIFNFAAITSRQTMHHKDTYIIYVTDDRYPGKIGVGECALFRGLSREDNSDYESTLTCICQNINDIDVSKIQESSIRFGLETAMWSLYSYDRWHLFPNGWTDELIPIPINGLVWMGDFETMLNRLNQKISEGFSCIKIKIGGIDFEQEVDLIRHIRDCYSNKTLTIRLDANGSFLPSTALRQIDTLAKYDIHSLEQPIKPGQWDKMKYISCNSPIPIALDEELIGNMDYDARNYLLDSTQTSYIVLKPSLHGGFATCDQWINDAAVRGIGWWATSALESNIGLNAIAQWVSTKKITTPQGLGTGSLYTNNFSSPICVENGDIVYDNHGKWDNNTILNL